MNVNKRIAGLCLSFFAALGAAGCSSHAADERPSTQEQCKSEYMQIKSKFNPDGLAAQVLPVHPGHGKSYCTAELGHKQGSIIWDVNNDDSVIATNGKCGDLKPKLTQESSEIVGRIPKQPDACVMALVVR